MKINGIEVEETIQTAKLLLDQDVNISKATQSVFKVILVLLQIMLERLCGEELKLFSSKSEKSKSNKQQKDDDTNTKSSGHEDTINVKSHTRKKKGNKRNLDTSQFPKLKIDYDIDEDKRLCGCCNGSLSFIGHDVTETLEIIPSLFYVIEHKRAKYTCRCCQTVIAAPKPMELLDKSPVGNSVITEVITNKFQYHLPLYRQGKMFSDLGADFADNTLSNWVMQTGDYLMELLAPAMWSAVEQANYLQVDESPLKVLIENKKGYLWVYYAPYVGQGLVMFEFATTRSASVVDSRLENYSGLLQTDAYAGYNNIKKRVDIYPLNCLTHVRRKFAEVVKITKNNDGLAAQFVSMIQPLYTLEAKMRELQVNHRIRKKWRKKVAWPILLQTKKWLKQHKNSVLPKSKLGQAIAHALNCWANIMQYARHGKAEIDTNWIENEIRPSAVGKRNWLFVYSKVTGNINAFWFSLVQSAAKNGLNVKTYINFLLDNAHKIRKKEIGFDASNLLPHNIDKQLLASFEQQRVKNTQKLFIDDS